MGIQKFENFELNEQYRPKSISLLKFQLYDKSYGNGERASGKTLAVSLSSDNTLYYVLFGGWQSSGTGFSINNLQLQETLPKSIAKFKTVDKLKKEIERILRTGVGAKDVHNVEVVNEIPTPGSTTFTTAEDLRNLFKKETGTDYINSQDEPDIDYVHWLEAKLVGSK